jgi:hypothetical protein
VTAGTFVGRRHPGANFGEALAEIIQQLPALELLLIDLFLGPARTHRKPERI